MSEILIKYIYTINRYFKEETGEDNFLLLIDLAEKCLHDYEKELVHDLCEETYNYIKSKRKCDYGND